ncbi:hypothetical protein NUU61_005058 [Penicillium alfredii]|uniref:Uncharacterized protein n=1 Tax=Penicillium alfredii TaxID=1506179 RepID=A0A9W9K873_9EURO|nr:uncharacterized protein NUU61_005058 [Penicillium alfredii]KAJ5095702.1 hypothetical protein NUU61_005058 [Penicillium alfredii]
MSGVEVMSAAVDSRTLERPLLRSHKTLPRRNGVPSIELAQPASADPNAIVTAAPAPPLTPPDAGQNELAGDDPTPRKMASSFSDNQTTGMLTPRRPSKPPTPDVTPPRTTLAKRPVLNQLIHPSSSSRADSFQTAYEGFSSDGDLDTPIRSSQMPRTTNNRRQTFQSHSRNTSRSKPAITKESPLSASLQLSETEYDTGFESFDGEWATNHLEQSPTPLVGKRKSVQMPNRSGRKAELDGDALNVQHLDNSLMREKTLRDRVHDSHELSATPSIEQFRDEIGWPSGDGPLQNNPHDRPLSGISSTSTVEAMIIDSPKRAQRMLRHTEKKTSLRSASSPIPTSDRTSTGSNPEFQHRLIHKALRISDQDRQSVSSDVSFSSKTTSVPQSHIDSIPVVVIPERRSSLRSGPNSYASSKPGSQRSSRQPPTARTGPVERPRQQRKRTMSDSVSARSQPDARSRPLTRPVVPPRSSSLSAPTSRNNSRAPSLTSESLHSHNLAIDHEMQQHQNQQPVSPPRHNVLGPNGYGLRESPNVQALSSDDMATLRPPSLPYTQASIPSSSPGPIEIHEATAVSLFAHNNRSLLLVEQRVQSEANALQALRKELRARANPRTPDMPVRAATISVDSPLKNPRPPPQPPIHKPLPPLPKEENTTQGSEGNGLLSRRWDSVRRTWSARPRSDSFNSMARSLSMKSAKNRKAGIEMDSRLHPFWRPRGFWDDVPGSPPKRNPPAQSDARNPNESLVVNNSLGMPQQRIVFNGPPSLARRSPEMKRLFDAMPSSVHHNASCSSLVDRGILRTGSPLYQNRYWALSRWGLRLRSMPLRNVRNRLRRFRQRRDERKRAARRATLKQSIGGPVYVASSATNGVVAK